VSKPPSKEKLTRSTLIRAAHNSLSTAGKLCKPRHSFCRQQAESQTCTRAQQKPCTAYQHCVQTVCHMMLSGVAIACVLSDLFMLSVLPPNKGCKQGVVHMQYARITLVFAQELNGWPSTAATSAKVDCEIWRTRAPQALSS